MSAHIFVQSFTLDEPRLCFYEDTTVPDSARISTIKYRESWKLKAYYKRSKVAQLVEHPYKWNAQVRVLSLFLYKRIMLINNIFLYYSVIALENKLSKNNERTMSNEVK